MTLMADNDQVITFDRLPATAQTMLKQNFSDKVPLVITADWDDFKVMYTNGDKVEFDKKGNWRDIECKTSQVPADLVPAQIVANVNATFPGAVVTEIDRDRRGYSVKLSNGLELEYNTRFQIVELDD
ncbi:MAG: PepSY-like domain-containing protein [Bacteroidales bacterium]|nr:PepSY-like domain-containing protein [Bacteroidales bacterium]